MKNKWIYWCGLLILVFFCLSATVWAEEAAVGVAYRGHIQDLGDYPADGSWVDSPEMIGTTGQSKRIEGFEIKLTGTVPEGMELRYNVHVQNKGWLYDENDSTDWPKDGAYAGTSGESLRIEAVKIVLTDRDGKAAPGYSVQYRGHVQNVGDLPKAADQWRADGVQLGTVGSSLRLEALLVQVVKTQVKPGAELPPVSPNPGGDSSEGIVTGITLNKTTLDLNVGDDESLTATVAPINATDKDVTWTSTDPSVVTVDANGKVKAIGVGIATITATSGNGKMASCTVATTGFYVIKITNDTGSIIGMRSSSKVITIPETICGLTIISIESGAFDSTDITSVAIPKTVKKIGNDAFCYCYALQMVTFEPDSTLETIGESAFEHTGITSVEIPKTVKVIDVAAFFNCSALQTVTFEQGSTLKIIQISAFARTGITSVVIPKTAILINNNAFYNCSALKTVSFEPDAALTVIGSGVFVDCNNLGTIVIPAGVSDIPDRVFLGCGKLSSVSLPASLATLGKDVFLGAGVQDNTGNSSLVVTFKGNAPRLIDPASLGMSPGTKIQYYAGCTGFDTTPWNETGKYPINVLDAWINNSTNEDNN